MVASSDLMKLFFDVVVVVEIDDVIKVELLLFLPSSENVSIIND